MMTAQYGFLDFLAFVGWTWVEITVTVAVIALLAWVLSELWNMPGPGPRK